MTVVKVLIILFLILLLYRSIVIIRPHQAGIVERLGRYVKTLGGGFHFIIPFMDKIIRVDLREQVVDVPAQEVITKDNVIVTVDGIIYYKVVRPEDVTYKVSNFVRAAIALAQTNLRNIIGELSLDDTLTSREIINTKLRSVLDEATDGWGVKVTRVEIKRIDPPTDVMQAMHKQMKAEREKRAMILEAEGVKEAQIQKALGVKQAQILKAEGEAKAMELIAKATKERLIEEAQGHAQALALLKEATPDSAVLLLQYFEALKAIAQSPSSKLFFPLELSGFASALELMADGLKKKEGGKE